MNSADEAAFEAFKIAQHMSRDLDTVSSLSDLVQVRIALRHAGHCDEMIDNHLMDAVEVAQDRRSLKRYISGMLEASILSFCIGVMYLVFAPDRAFAGEVQPMSQSVDWVTTISLAIFFVWLVYLSLPAIRTRKDKVNISEPFADEQDWGRH